MRRLKSSCITEAKTESGTSKDTAAAQVAWGVMERVTPSWVIGPEAGLVTARKQRLSARPDIKRERTNLNEHDKGADGTDGKRKPCALFLIAARH